MKNVTFSKIILFDNSKGYHNTILWEGNEMTLTEAMQEIEAFKFESNYKTSLEVTY